MLSKENNDLLTQVGPGTPMGQVLRQFWTPALRSAKLAVDGAPERVRLFGENFVAFRDTNGKVGFLDEGCPHRGVSLALGRNEECGLRCIFHGWKINVEGQVVDIPSEPEGSNLASKVRVKHYEVREAGGLVWVWLGKGEEAPPFPTFEFMDLPPENVVVRKAIIECNWVGLIEGLLDSSHVSSLHKAWLPTGKEVLTGPNAGMLGALSVNYEIDEKPYGFTAAAKRNLPDGTQVNRYTEFVMPWHCFIPNTLKTLHSVTIPVPVDDETTNFWGVAWDTAEPLDAPTLDRKRNAGALGPDPDNYYETGLGADQRWGQDRELMKHDHYAGFKALPFEDFAVTKSQGKITDRTREHLGASDIAVIRVRRLLLDLARDFQDGKLPRLFTGEVAYREISAVHEIIAPPGQRLEVS
jgi:phthalate 4,5-dioxygenase